MPIYEYRCAACGHAFERMQKMSAPPVRKCPKCGKNRVEKCVSRSAVKFEGTGWYVTDYAKKAVPLKEKGDSGAESKPAEKAEEK
jgi:putative FmdB family regulatory protein